ncbi:MAG: hypothetical protein JST54_32180 [Deltaproteobacteria bacterium]|nr:hypothetical protein [Deltaproteobacteria bacterium]
MITEGPRSLPFTVLVLAICVGCTRPTRQVEPSCEAIRAIFHATKPDLCKEGPVAVAARVLFPDGGSAAYTVPGCTDESVNLVTAPSEEMLGYSLLIEQDDGGLRYLGILADVGSPPGRPHPMKTYFCGELAGRVTWEDGGLSVHPGEQPGVELSKVGLLKPWR